MKKRREGEREGGREGRRGERERNEGRKGRERERERRKVSKQASEFREQVGLDLSEKHRTLWIPLSRKFTFLVPGS